MDYRAQKGVPQFPAYCPWTARASMAPMRGVVTQTKAWNFLHETMDCRWIGLALARIEDPADAEPHINDCIDLTQAHHHQLKDGHYVQLSCSQIYSYARNRTLCCEEALGALGYNPLLHDLNDLHIPFPEMADIREAALAAKRSKASKQKRVGDAKTAESTEKQVGATVDTGTPKARSAKERRVVMASATRTATSASSAKRPRCRKKHADLAHRTKTVDLSGNGMALPDIAMVLVSALLSMDIDAWEHPPSAQIISSERLCIASSAFMSMPLAEDYIDAGHWAEDAGNPDNEHNQEQDQVAAEE